MLKVANDSSALHGQGDVVQAVQQTVPAEGISRERDRCFSVDTSYLLLLQIDLEIEAGFSVLGQLDALLLGYGYWEHTVLHRIIAEDIGEAGGNDAANTEIVSNVQNQYRTYRIKE